MNLFQRIKGALFGAPLILLSIGLIFFAVGGGLTYYQIIFRQDATQAQGEVIELAEGCDDDGCAFSPIVRFTTANGETAFYHSTFGSYPPEYQIGERVTIFYKPETPEKAIIGGEGGILRYVFIGIGAVIVLSGLIFFAVTLKNSFLSDP